jgi:hypothetical protein
MDIDEPRREHQAIGVNRATRRSVHVADVSDPTIANRNICSERRAPGAVNDRCTSNDEIRHLRLLR